MPDSPAPAAALPDQHGQGTPEHNMATMPATAAQKPAAAPRAAPPAASKQGPPVQTPPPAAVVADAHAGHEMTTAANPAARLADLMCEPKVDPRTAPRATYNGKAYYFCSEADRDLFLKEPAKYLER